MVEALTGVIEQTLVLSKALANKCMDIIIFHVCAFDHLVGNSDILGMMLAVMDTKSLLAQMRL